MPNNRRAERRRMNLPRLANLNPPLIFILRTKPKRQAPLLAPLGISVSEQVIAEATPACCPVAGSRDFGAEWGYTLIGGCMRMRNRATLFLAAISLLALAAGCSSTQKDQALATDIKAKMFSDPLVRGASVDVAVKNGEATLSGEVPNDGARYEAYKIANDTAGAKHVTDKMVVQSAPAMPAHEPVPVE